MTLLITGCTDPLAVPGPEANSLPVTVGLETEVGLRQSPIDIRFEDLAFRRKLPRLGFRYGSDATLTMVNTGSPEEEATIRANVAAGAARLRVGGMTYTLLQFHFHTPSEHLIEGEETPIEMHLVHQAADGGLLVVGVFIEAGRRHGELAKIFGALPEDEEDEREVTDFNLNRLLPGKLASFRYLGSLTTAPFTEGVRWIVLAKPIELSPQQIAAFKELFPEGNTREVQPLNDRRVVTDVRR